MYVFGGQDDENNKLNDLWEFDSATNSWKEIESTQGYQPLVRSGHSSVVYKDKMFVFGGILEITKELNDMIVFDFVQNKFGTFEQAVEEDAVHHNYEESPHRHEGNLAPVQF